MVTEVETQVVLFELQIQTHNPLHTHHYFFFFSPPVSYFVYLQLQRFSSLAVVSPRLQVGMLIFCYTGNLGTMTPGLGAGHVIFMCCNSVSAMFLCVMA